MIKSAFCLIVSLAVLSGCAVSSSRPEIKKSSARQQRQRPQQPQHSKASHPAPQAPVIQEGKIVEQLVTVPTAPQAPGLAEEKPTPPETSLLTEAEGFEKAGQWLEALYAYEKLTGISASLQDQTLFRLKTQSIIDTKLNEEQLQTVSANTEMATLRAHSLMRMAINNFNAKNFEAAEEQFKAAQDLLPGSDLSFQADTYLSNLRAVKQVSPTSIGVVLPLTGKSAPIGQRTLRGIEMGLGIGLPGNNFKLVVADSEGEVENARAGAERLIKEENVIALIGDVLSKTSPAVASVAQQFNVPLINLSQRPDITATGDFVFRNALTAEMQIHYLVRTAIQDLGMKRFAVMFPNSTYGTDYANLFWDYVNAYGGKVVAAQPYSPTEKDFRFPVQRLLGIYYGESRREEYNQKMSEIRSSDKKKSIRSSNNENVLTPITDFDALFVADGLQQLGIISSMLSYYDVPKMYFLGTNIWNNSALAKRLGNFTDSAIFTDSYQSQFNGTDRYKFVQDYKAQYNEEPGLFEIQGYDSALLLRQFIVEGSQSRASVRGRLEAFEQFPASIGYLSSGRAREIERPLTAFTLKKGEIVPLKVTK